MKFKRLFDNSEEFIFNEVVRLVSNSWKRAYRIKKAVQSTKHMVDEDIQEEETGRPCNNAF